MGRDATDSPTSANQPIPQNSTSAASLFLIFWRLGLTSFGGPVAHLGYFHEEFVARRKWFTEAQYAELVACCQFMPGPASSQVGLAIGLSRGGYLGAALAWAGFTLPSAIALTIFALIAGGTTDGPVGGAIVALKIVAVAVVVHALWGMYSKLVTGRACAALMLAALAACTLFGSAWMQIAVIVVAGLIGVVAFRSRVENAEHTGGFTVPVGTRAAAGCLAAFATLLVALPVAAALTPGEVLAQFTAFYQSGALVFGGGHVVLPLLESTVVEPGWLTESDFLAGYAAAQAVPGPLFTISSYLGAVSGAGLTGWAGAFWCLAGMFTPAVLLVFGVLPLWQRVRSITALRAALIAVNAAVVGILAAALYDPVFTEAVQAPWQLVAAAFGVVALMQFKIPAWTLVAAAIVLGALGGAAL